MDISKKNMTASTFAENLRLYRTECGFSQQQIADRLQLHRASYSYYELGRTEPSTENIKKLAKLFNISTDTLLLHTPPSTPPGVNDPGLDKLLGSASICDLSKNEKELILCFRSLTDSQQKNWLETMHASITAKTSDE